MNEQQQKDYIDVLLGRKRPPQPKLSETDKFVKTLLDKVRKQKAASGAHFERIIRGG
jgi:hypothetical protein